MRPLISTATFPELKSMLVEDMRCPIDWSALPLDHDSRNIFLERWSRDIESCLAEDEGVEVLYDPEAVCYLPEPSDESFWRQDLDVDTARQLAFNVADARSAYLNRYKMACAKISRLQPLGADEYPKHYLQCVKSSNDVRIKSEADPSASILMPYLTPAVQYKLLWPALAEVFHCFLEKHVGNASDETMYLHSSESFYAAWDDVFGLSQSRITVDLIDECAGFTAGQAAPYLVYDISYDTSVFHCYPSPTPLGVSASSDDVLQGAQAAFERGDTLTWLDSIHATDEE